LIFPTYVGGSTQLEKRPVFAPMPRMSVSKATAAKQGMQTELPQR
jgi:hypothetical protein